MGRGFIDYRMPESGAEHSVLFSAFLYYRLADSMMLSVEQQPAWCHRCSSFVVAEDIRSVDALQEEIRKLETGDPETLEIWMFVSNGKLVAGRIRELQRRLEWRRHRVSPPRCLQCGSTDIFPISESGEFPHPVTGEHVIEWGCGLASAEEWCAEFSPEGESLSK